MKIGGPFFAYIPYHAVHVPFTTSNYDYYEMHYSQGYSEDQTNCYNTITTMDETVGQIQELMVSATTKCFDLPLTMDLTTMVQAMLQD